MLYAPQPARLSVRAEADGSRTVSGSFPYNSKATLSDGGRNGGRPRKEQIASGAFSHRIEDETADIHLLSGHDYGKPLASKLTDSLKLSDGKDSLDFSANISAEVANTSHGSDALALVGAGLSVGLSPGFRIPPQRTVEDAETTEEEPKSEGDAIIRTVNAALLYELSIVTRPAYKDSEVEARSWNLDQPTPRRRPTMWGYR